MEINQTIRTARKSGDRTIDNVLTMGTKVIKKL